MDIKRGSFKENNKNKDSDSELKKQVSFALDE